MSDRRGELWIRKRMGSRGCVLDEEVLYVVGSTRYRYKVIDIYEGTVLKPIRKQLMDNAPSTMKIETYRWKLYQSWYERIC